MASSINADNGVVSGSSGVKTTADTSGVLALQSNGSTGLTLNTDLSVTFAGSQTYSAGTANGVTYLNGSKVLTSGSALTFDGTTIATTGKFGITGNGSIPTAAALEIGTNGVGSRILYNVPTGGEHNFTVNNSVISFQTASVHGWNISGTEGMRLGSSGLSIGTSTAPPLGNFYSYKSSGQNVNYIETGGSGNDAGLFYKNGVRTWQTFVNGTDGAYRFYDVTAAAERLRIDSSGNVGIGTSSPTSRLQVTGSSPFVNIIQTGASNGLAVGFENADGSARINTLGGNYDIKFLMQNTERFRMGASGQFGIGGANFGTSGQVLTSGGSGAAPTWATPSSGGLVLISSTDATAAATLSSLSGFSSTYDNYMIILQGISPASGNPKLQMRLAVGGTADSASSYTQASGTNSVGGGSQSAATSIQIVATDMSNTASQSVNLILHIQDVNTTARTKSIQSWASYYGSVDSAYQAIAAVGRYTPASIVSGIQFFFNGSQNFRAQGSLKIYGYKNS